MPISISHVPTLKIGQTVSFTNGTLVADGSIAEGGDGAGPSPHELYDAALGACKAITIMWYARRKAIPVDDVSVDVTHDASQERAGHYIINAEIVVRGPLSEEQMAELRTVAEKCPVHKLMTAVTTDIRTSLTLES
jgi:putative redox protein